MTPDQQDNTTQDDKEDVPISDLFPSFDQALATLLHDSFDVPKESYSTLCEALIASQYRTWSDFLFIEDIDYLTYQDRGTRVPLTQRVQLNLQRFIDFGQHLTEQGLDWKERQNYTKKAFKDYCQGIVKARRDSAADGGMLTNATTTPDGPGRPTKPIDQLKCESWIRQPRDKTTFPVLQNDARFEHWLVKFKATLETSDIDTHIFLDPDWSDNALTGYPKALHDQQCAFFWTLLRHVFQGDFSSSCVLYHQGTRNGCQAYFDFVELHNPVSPPTPPTPPAAPVVSSPGPIRPPAIGNIVTPRPTPPVSPLMSVPIPSGTPTVHRSTPTSACETDVHSTVDNPATPTGLPGRSNPGSTADSSSTGTPSYTWKYFPRNDSVRFTKIDSPSTLGLVPTDTPPHFTRTRKTSPANSRWTFYPQSETVVFHRARSAPQPSCISSLQLPPSGASSQDSVVSSSVKKPLHGMKRIHRKRPKTRTKVVAPPGFEIQQQAREKKLDGSVERAAQKIEPEVFCGETDWKEQIAKSICPEGTDCKKHLPARKQKSKDMRTPIPKIGKIQK
eukprot:jgi/Psemu1/34976/gm1.34976_g